MTFKTFSLIPSIALAASCFACASSTPQPAEAPAAAAPAPAQADPDDVHIEGDHLIIDDHINFAHDSDEILSSSDSLLDHIALLLKNHTEIVSIDVIGHTDSSGDDEHNQELSERRARAVAEALMSLGVPQELSHHGRGEDDPLCGDDSAECHELNRRVEVKIAMR